MTVLSLKGPFVVCRATATVRHLFAPGASARLSSPRRRSIRCDGCGRPISHAAQYGEGAGASRPLSPVPSNGPTAPSVAGSHFCRSQSATVPRAPRATSSAASSISRPASAPRRRARRTSHACAAPARRISPAPRQESARGSPLRACFLGPASLSRREPPAAPSLRPLHETVGPKWQAAGNMLLEPLRLDLVDTLPQERAPAAKHSPAQVRQLPALLPHERVVAPGPQMERRARPLVEGPKKERNFGNLLRRSAV